MSFFSPRTFSVSGLVALFLLMGAGSAYAQTGGAGESPALRAAKLAGEIHSVKFEGNDNFSAGQLAAVVESRPATWLERTLHSVISSLGRPRQFVDPVTLSRDTASLEQWYKDRGYMNAEVGYQLSIVGGSEEEYQRVYRINRTLPKAQQQKLPNIQVEVVFQVNEGQTSKISGIAYSGLEDLPEEFQPELTERSLVKRGERYERKDVVAEVERLDSILIESGYPYFSHDSIFVDQLYPTNKVRIIMYFQHGPRLKFGHVRYEYDSSLEDSRVSERVLRATLSIDSGSWYQASKVQSSQQQLLRLNTFDVARINLDTSLLAGIPDSNLDGTAVPVVISLRMKVTQLLTPGLYAGTGIAGFTTGLTAGYDNLNLFGGAEHLAVEAGYQLTPSDQTRYNGTADLTLPYIGIKNVPVSLGLGFGQNSQKNRYAETKYFARTAATIIFGDPIERTNLTPGVSVEYLKTEYLDSNLIQQVDFRRILKQINTIFSATFQRDKTSDLFQPTSGFFASTTGEVALPILRSLAPKNFSSAAYAKGVAQGKYFYSLRSDRYSVLGARLRAGYIDLFDPTDPLRLTPFDRRFYAGGQTSVRGWGAKELLISNDSVQIDNGGYRLLEFNAEWRFAPFFTEYPITTKEKILNGLHSVLFFDAGQAWDYGVKLSPKDLGMAVGLGFRYNILFGAIRLDWGLKLYDPNPSLNRDYRTAGQPGTQGKWLWQRVFGHEVMAFGFGIGQVF